MAQTLQDRLIAANKRPSGFDYMRLMLATSVVLSHTMPVSYGIDWTLNTLNGPLRMVNSLILPLFFALSGFLVAGSLERCRTLVSFLGLRAIRLMPALAVETCLAALLLGPFLTTLPLSAYFSDPAFHAYFYNIIGHVHFALPGVFLNNPVPGMVNAQLWTLPFELICYIAISGLAFLRIVRRAVGFLPMLIALNLAIIAFYTIRSTPLDAAVMPGLALVQCFLYGIAFYLYRERIIWNGWLCLACLVITLGLLSAPMKPVGDLLVPVFAVYVTVYLGLLQPKRTVLVTSGDYSYGIFLYGYPVQQAVALLMGSAGQVWHLNFAIAFPIILIIAMFSWHFIEKPALGFRTPLIHLEDVALKLADRFSWLKWILPTPLPARPAGMKPSPVREEAAAL